MSVLKSRVSSSFGKKKPPPKPAINHKRQAWGTSDFEFKNDKVKACQITGIPQSLPCPACLLAAGHMPVLLASYRLATLH